ncbi:MAG TPA: fibronectin type III-like domain-contianing protein [Kiritimatiellia bacterium]|nr:fibronectin type III-like domain-contianing protein [Kiritimatiellia bacterium]
MNDPSVTTAPCAGAETVRLHMCGEVASIVRRARELKAFAKARPAPGAAQRVAFELGRRELGVWNPGMRFGAEPGRARIEVAVGDGTLVQAALVIV